MTCQAWSRGAYQSVMHVNTKDLTLSWPIRRVSDGVSIGGVGLAQPSDSRRATMVTALLQPFGP